MPRQSPEQVAADLTPNGIAANLIQLSYELDDLVKEYRGLGEGAADAKREAEVAYAKAYMSAAGTVEERRQAAIEAAVDARFIADLAERKVSGCREAIRAVHARIEVGRTLSATTRDEMRLAGSGVHGA
jgi:hypothetical protein